MFRHAGECGAKIFDGVKVKSIEFDTTAAAPAENDLPNPGKPIAAMYEVKATKETGRITFDYVVDASGRAGVLSTQYLKNRRFNQGPGFAVRRLAVTGPPKSSWNVVVIQVTGFGKGCCTSPVRSGSRKSSLSPNR